MTIEKFKFIQKNFKPEEIDYYFFEEGLKVRTANYNTIKVDENSEMILIQNTEKVTVNGEQKEKVITSACFELDRLVGVVLKKPSTNNPLMDNLNNSNFF